ncbi:ERAD-associated protein [Tulasnella sp. 403]|nr:ERAD-associated protein [Tulasnella sp. 403]
MARRRRQALARRIAFVSFFLVVTSSLAVFAQQPAPPIATPDPLNVPVETETPEIAEANKAYLKALRAIRTLSSLSSSQVSAYYADVHPQPSGLMMSLFPNEQGPIPKLVKLWYSLRPQNLIPDWLARRFGGRLGRRREEIRAYASKAVELLTLAIERGHEDALFTMAEVSLFPPPAMHLNVSRAFHYYFKHAETTGNATSQAMLGFFYATGYGGAVEIDQSQALLYYTFAALGGFQRAEMVMGYRYWAGIGVNEDCMAALGWYENAAEKSMNYFMSGPPGGRTLPNSITRLSDLDGGVYGPGASVASTGSNSGRSVMKAASSRAAGETWEDVLEYYHYHAERGEVDFAYRLGKIYYHGSVYTASGGAASGAEGVGAIGRDFARARSYFVSITRLVWPANSINFPLVNKKEVEERISTAAAMAAGYMGRMHLRGEGVKQDFMVARMWFERGAEYGDRESQMGLGLIHRDGLIDGKIDLGKAMNYFTAAAGQDLAEAQVQLGKHYYAHN